VHLARPRGSVLATYSPLCLEVHANSQFLNPTTSAPPRRRTIPPSPPLSRPSQRQLKRKKHSISIVGRARQWVRPSHLIGSASARDDSASPHASTFGPSHSRSRLATRNNGVTSDDTTGTDERGHPASYGHAHGRLPWAYSRPRAAFSARVRMEPNSSGILGMFRRSRFNLRARSKAPRLRISRNSGTSLPITPAT
jgi:hypothetical protein